MKSYVELPCNNIKTISAGIYNFLQKKTDLLNTKQFGWHFIDCKQLLDHVPELLDFFKQQIAMDKRIFDLETFGFCNWAYEQNFTPLDFCDSPGIGHYGSDAHYRFANTVLLPKLNELSIL